MRRKNMKTIGLAVALTATIIGSSLSCAASSGTVSTETAVSSTGKKAIYLVNGSLGDKGFYDSAENGMKAIQKNLGWETKTVEMGRDETTYESNFLDAVDEDYDLIIAGTWSVLELTENTAAEYPDQDFIIFDCSVDRSIVTEGNCMGITYQSHQAAYLAGVLAAKMLDSGDKKIDPDQRTLGFVGSMDTANINEFLIGYLEGVKSVDDSIKVLSSYVGSFEDVPKCMEMTSQLYSQGAQIVYAPTSQSMMGAATAARDADKYLIACDQDLYSQLVDSQPDLAANILTSTLKKVGDSLETAVEGYQKGTVTCAEDLSLGLESGAVGLAKNDNYVSIVPKDIQDAVDETEKKIIDGDIKVDDAIEMQTDEIAKMRDSAK
ncbi:MAG: BMP family ABC transporter substrate-binding protein [Clostridiales bacterium]|nr:BMP family ABC transporter substrate-binding protein [Clostridiales bacterium]